MKEKGNLSQNILWHEEEVSIANQAMLINTLKD